MSPEQENDEVMKQEKHPILIGITIAFSIWAMVEVVLGDAWLAVIALYASCFCQWLDGHLWRKNV
jgi:phosphatidylglycerophosphate synthase